MFFFFSCLYNGTNCDIVNNSVLRGYTSVRRLRGYAVGHTIPDVRLLVTVTTRGATAATEMPLGHHKNCEWPLVFFPTRLLRVKTTLRKLKKDSVVYYFSATHI